MEVHDFTKSEHTDTYTTPHSPFPSSESQFGSFQTSYQYFNDSWLQSSSLQLLAAILYHLCRKFHCCSGLCLDFYYPLVQTWLSGVVQVCTQVWVQQLAHLPPLGPYYLLSVLWKSLAATSQGRLHSQGAICADRSLHSKSKGNPHLGTNRSSTQGSWGIRWQLPVISLQCDCLWALKLLSVFAALRGLSPQKPRSLCKMCTMGIGPKRLPLSPVSLWFNRV